MYFNQLILNNLTQFYKQTIMIKAVENGGDGKAGKYNKSRFLSVYMVGVYYRKSVLHLLKRTRNRRLSRCSTDVR